MKGRVKVECPSTGQLASFVLPSLAQPFPSLFLISRHYMYETPRRSKSKCGEKTSKCSVTCPSKCAQMNGQQHPPTRRRIFS